MQQVENTNVGTLPNAPSLSESTPNKWLNVGAWILQILLALMFLMSGGMKIAGVDLMVEEFEKIGIGQWFRYVTGAIEIGAAILLLIPRFSGFGAVLLAATMVGAVFTHLFIFGDSPAVPGVLLAHLLVVVWARRETIKQVL